MKYLVKFTSLTALLLALLSGASLFWVSQQVQQVEREQRKLYASISQEEESLRVLRAEWDYLNRPERLEELSAKYLNMAPVNADTMIQSVSAIPEPEDITSPPDETPIQIATVPQHAPQPAVPQPLMPSPALGRNEAPSENNFQQVLGNIDDDTRGDEP